MQINAKMVNELRQRTGAGIMDCKRALQETSGDLEKAVTYLREKGMASASKRAGRVAAEGQVEAYIHMGGRIGVLVEVNCETDFVARGEDFKNFCREVAMQVAAANPQYLSRDDVPAEVVEAEKQIYRKQAQESGKPEKIWDQIAEGRLKKFFSEVCLLDQPYIREQKMTVDKLRQELVAKTGENVVVRRFARFELGEGIEKKKSDLAAEVAAQLGQAQAEK
ncbi:MAG: translation elongation factor Ts [Deltaproteobacteria bacterium]|nr:MAG: translation elongation factor Ts [Deltaproteobacteria bacterium]